MKKRNSKKGFTLVELVVTLAVLSITAAMGTSIFIMVFNNYGEASHASFSQQQAVALEDVIREYCKACKDVEIAAGGIGTMTTSGTYFYTNSDGILYIDDYDAKDSGTHTRFTLSGIKTLQTKYVKRTSAQDANSGYIVMQYAITTNDDFVLEGSIVLNNSDISSCGSLLSGTFDLNTSTTKYMLIT